MAQAVLEERNGPDAEENDSQISTLNFGSVDEPDLNASENPVLAEPDGASYEKWLRMRVTEIDTGETVDNVKFWLSQKTEDWKTDERIVTNLTHLPHKYSAATYPTDGPVDSRSEVATRDIPEKEPIEANVGIGGQLAGSIDTVDELTDWIVLQLHVSDKTESGALSDKVFTLQWDET